MLDGVVVVVVVVLDDPDEPDEPQPIKTTAIATTTRAELNAKRRLAKNCNFKIDIHKNNTSGTSAAKIPDGHSFGLKRSVGITELDVL